MTDAASPLMRRLALLWLLLVGLVAGHNLWLWTGDRLQLDTDVLAMLPQDQRDPAVQQATRRLADAATRRIVVLVGADDWADARRAGDAYAAVLASARLPLALQYRVSDRMADDWLSFFAPYRQALLSARQAERLASRSPQALADDAVAALYRPVGMPRLGPWIEDPLNLYGDWLTERAADSRVRPADGRLSLQVDGRAHAVLMLEQQGPAFSISAQQALMPWLERAAQAAQQAAPGVRVLSAGVPLHAAAAASQAEREVHTIGFGSLAGIILLTVFAFSALRPRVLVTLAIGVGLLAAVSVTAALFGRLHLLTLVFGASLVGVAENYGTNYFAGRLGQPPASRWRMVREQAPVMGLALLTTLIGYLALALTPFPGLKQMAVFSAVGLLASFLTVMLWFPFLERGYMSVTPLSAAIGRARRYWPRVGRNRATLLLALLLAGLLLGGGWRLQANDDIRLLQSSPATLIEQQLAISRLLDLPSPAQFYLVRGATPDQVLAREEALKARLDALVGARWIRGYQAVSDWVPSAARQRASVALLRRTLDGDGGVIALATQRLGETPAAARTAGPVPLMTLARWLAAPVSEPLRPLWLGRLDGGYASVIMLRGVDSPDRLPRLAALADGLPGVRWVDKVAEVSSVLSRYRQIMGGVILASYLLVLAALWRRFGRKAWRALLPTALASLLTLAMLALFGQPLQLFNVLALLLILGMGVDYGIFLQEQPDPDAGAPFLSVTLGAACTLLSFGLLALSHTPALRAFGLTMLLGIGLSWLLAPMFCSGPARQKERTP